MKKTTFGWFFFVALKIINLYKSMTYLIFRILMCDFLQIVSTK